MSEALFLTSDDLAGLAIPAESVDAVREAYRQVGEGAPAQPRTSISSRDPARHADDLRRHPPRDGCDGRLHLLGGLRRPATRSSSPRFDAASGEPLAVLDGAFLDPCKAGAVGAEEVTVFDSGGTAIETVAAAHLLDERAADRGLGTPIEFAPASEAMQYGGSSGSDPRPRRRKHGNRPELDSRRRCSHGPYPRGRPRIGMSVVVDVTIPPESFALHRSLSAEPEVTVEAERVASHSTEGVLPFLWAAGGDRDAFREAMEDDPTVADVRHIEEGDGSELLQVMWDEDFTRLIDEMIDQHANVLEAKANAARWQLRLRFVEEGEVSAFRDYFAERGRTFAVERLFRPTTTRQRAYGLTTEQYETLVTALQAGYFAVPRAVTIEELADRLGISSNATSQRVRRATGNLVRHTLMVGDGDGPAGE